MPRPADPPAKGEDTGDPPAGGDKLKTLDLLKISVAGTFAEAPLRDVLVVIEPGGKIALGPEYGGRVKVEGLTLEEAEAAIQKHLCQFLKSPTVTVTRYIPVPGERLERRVEALEKEVNDLRAEVEALRKKKP